MQYNEKRFRVDVHKTKYHYFNNQLHCEDGPAVEYATGEKHWFLYGKRHREDGPAIEWINSHKSWYLRGKYVDCQTQEKFEQLMKLKAFW